MTVPPRQAHLASLLCDERLLAHRDPAEAVDVTIAAAAPHAAPAADDGRPEPPAPLASLDRLDDDEALRLWPRRAIRAEIDLAIRRTDAFWDLYYGNEAIARAVAREDELSSRLTEIEHERDAAGAAARAIQRSVSWRLTAPLRRAKRLLRPG